MYRGVINRIALEIAQLDNQKRRLKSLTQDVKELERKYYEMASVVPHDWLRPTLNHIIIECGKSTRNRTMWVGALLQKEFGLTQQQIQHFICITRAAFVYSRHKLEAQPNEYPLYEKIDFLRRARIEYDKLSSAARTNL